MRRWANIGAKFFSNQIDRYFFRRYFKFLDESRAALAGIERIAARNPTSLKPISGSSGIL
jgi:hypothetical protein